MLAFRLPVAALVLISFQAHAFAGKAIGWRTDGTGRYPRANPPKEWSAEKNVVWKAKLPGRSHSAPVVVNERIFVTAEPNLLLCIKAADGKIEWQNAATHEDVFGKEKAAEIARDQAKAKELEKERRTLRREVRTLQKSDNPPKDKIEALQKKERELREKISALQKYTGSVRGANGNTTATPVSDGEYIYAAFGNGIVASYSLSGEKKWFKYVEGAKIGFGHSSSPVIADGKFIVHYQNLVALDTANGKESWRATVQAKHGSPIVVKAGEEEVVITPSGTAVRAKDGTILANKLFQIGHASPVEVDGVIYAMAKGRVMAIRVPASAGTDVEWKTLWQGRGMNQRTFGSPVLVNGKLYNVTEKGILDVLDAKTGRTITRKRLTFGRRGRVYASPTLAGKYVYLSGGDTTIVIPADAAYQELARNQLETFSGAPVFVGTRMYVRGQKYLYCIGGK